MASKTVVLYKRYGETWMVRIVVVNDTLSRVIVQSKQPWDYQFAAWDSMSATKFFCLSCVPHCN